jgi:hypothetical protein
MLDMQALARIGISRLRLPIGAHKLFVLHDIAQSLLAEDTGAVVADSLLEWLAGLYLESEVDEALAVIVLAGKTGVLQGHQIQSAITRPSVLSQAHLRQVFGIVPEVTSGGLPHSGPVPAFHRNAPLEEEVRSGQIVPGLLSSNFRHLTKQSGHDFMGQWVFEFERLAEQYPSSDGQLSYFLDTDRHQLSAQFVARRGHLARSAYLRVLAYGIDAWGMPITEALRSARLASPFDSFYLRMPPGTTPSWAEHTASVSDASGITGLLARMDKAIEDQEPDHRLLQFSGPLLRDMRCAIDLDVYTVLYRGTEFSVDRVFAEYEAALGATFAPRTRDGSIPVPPALPDIVGNEHEGHLILTLCPTLGATLGYIHADLIKRMPYVPANYGPEGGFLARPRLGGADLELGGVLVGQIDHWNVAWRPFHPQGLGPGCANSVTLKQSAISKLLNVPGFELKRIWRATVLERDSDFGTWRTEAISGILDLDD